VGGGGEFMRTCQEKNSALFNIRSEVDVLREARAV
jgi:hypothetical protein